MVVVEVEVVVVAVVVLVVVSSGGDSSIGSYSDGICGSNSCSDVYNGNGSSSSTHNTFSHGIKSVKR